MSAQGIFPRHGSLSAIYGQSGRSIRTVFIVAGAALGGLVIGGLSVLSVIAAIGSPPSHEAPVGSMVFDGAHVIRTAPAAAKPPPVASTPAAAIAPASSQPASAPPPQPAAPVEMQAAPPPQPGTQLAGEAKRKAPSTRSRRRPRTDDDVADGSQRNARPLYDFRRPSDRDDAYRSSDDGGPRYNNGGNFFGFRGGDRWRD